MEKRTPEQVQAAIAAAGVRQCMADYRHALEAQRMIHDGNAELQAFARAERLRAADDLAQALITALDACGK